MFSFDPIYSRAPPRLSFSTFVENFKSKRSSSLSLSQLSEPAIKFRANSDKKVKRVETTAERRRSIHSDDNFKSKESDYFKDLRTAKQHSKSTPNLTTTHIKQFTNGVAFINEFKSIPQVRTKILLNQASNFAPIQNPNPTTNKASNNMEVNSRELGHKSNLNKNSNFSDEKWKPYSKNNRRILFKGIADRDNKLNPYLIENRKDLVINPVGTVLNNLELGSIQNTTLAHLTVGKNLRSDYSKLDRIKNSLDKLLNVGKVIFKVAANFLEEILENVSSNIDKTSKGKIDVEDAIRIFVKLNELFGLRYQENGIKAFFKGLYIDNEYKLNLSEFKEKILRLVFYK
jgi:hypothetical protein